MSALVREYLKAADGVVHTTLDPYGPGAVRIHMVPPATPKEGVPWVIILNGQDVLPINTSWAILLREFILEANSRGGGEVSDEDLAQIVDATIVRLRKIYPKTDKKMLKSDLSEIVAALVDIARGIAPDVRVGYVSLAKYARHMRAPHRMDLMISAMEKDGAWNCNQHCLHCYAAGQALSSLEELPTQTWLRIIDRCREACIPQLTFTGGEPTMRGDLVELVRHASWFVTRLNTNGILLTESLCRELMDASLDSVQVTLYSADAAIHNALVGGTHHADTVRGIKNAVEAGLNVSINTPLCTLNRDFAATAAFAKQLGVRYLTCSGLILTGGARGGDSAATRLTVAELYDCVKAAVELCRNEGLELSFTSPGWLGEEQLRDLGLTVPSCGACMSNMAVAPDGTVIPCQSWLSGGGLGKLPDDTWKSIWNGERCRLIRERAARWQQVCLLSGDFGLEVNCK